MSHSNDMTPDELRKFAEALDDDADCVSWYATTAYAAADAWEKEHEQRLGCEMAIREKESRIVDLEERLADYKERVDDMLDAGKG